MAAMDDNFRVIPAQPHLTDQLIRLGVPENLDGVFGLVPGLTNELVSAAEAGDWKLAADKQRQLSGLLHVMRSSGNVFGCAEALLRARGINCHITPAPLQSLTEEQMQQFMSLPIVHSLL
jgi:dihydrodipicolinate synthase/N-acetylneuraminate lyase